MEEGTSITVDSPMHRPTRQYSPAEISNMAQKDLDHCLGVEQIDRETMLNCLADPRADVADAFVQRATDGDLLGVEVIGQRLHDKGDKGIQLGLWTATLRHNAKVVVCIISKFESSIRDLLGSVIQVFARHIGSSNQEASIEVLRFVIETGLVDINAGYRSEQTLLHFAMISKQFELAKCLLDLNANPFIRDRSGKLAYVATQPRSMIEVMRTFVNRNKSHIPNPNVWCTYYKNGEFSDSPVLEYSLKPQFNSVLMEGASCHLVKMEHSAGLYFTFLISIVAISLGYGDDSLILIHQFLSSTFLEQSGVEPHLKYRESSYNALMRLGRDPEGKGVASTVADTSRKPQSLHSARPQSRASKPLDEKPSPDAVSIVMPYFHTIPRTEFKDRRKAWEENILGPRKGIDLNAHEPRTLDESYYTGLTYNQFSWRNDDQIISHFGSSEFGHQPVLMVPQLWLFGIDNFVIASIPDHLRGFDPIWALETSIADGNPRIGETLSSRQLMALILSACISHMDRPMCAGLDDPIFFVFEKAVANIFEEVQLYMKAYSMDGIQMGKEKKFIYEINDIRDELQMIRNIVEQQEEVWNAFYKESEDDFAEWAISDPNLHQLAIRPKEQIPKFHRRIAKIDKDSERVKETLLTLLDLKAKHAALQESRNSTNLNTAVIGFTIITVVFTPLSFLTSLFALPIDKLQSSQVSNGNSSSYTSGYIGRWMAVGEIASLAFTAGLVVLAFYWYRLQQKAQELREERHEKELSKHSEESGEEDGDSSRDAAVPGAQKTTTSRSSTLRKIFSREKDKAADPER